MLQKFEMTCSQSDGSARRARVRPGQARPGLRTADAERLIEARDSWEIAGRWTVDSRSSG